MAASKLKRNISKSFFKSSGAYTSFKLSFEGRKFCPMEMVDGLKNSYSRNHSHQRIDINRWRQANMERNRDKLGKPAEA